MKYIKLIGLFISIVLITKADAQKTPKAVFVIADGIPADLIEKLNMPNLKALCKQGGFAKAYVGGEKNGYSQSPTISAVGYNSLLTGTWANKHNVWGNDIAEPNYNYWNIFRLFKKQFPEKKTAVFSTWIDNRTKLIGSDALAAGNLQPDYYFDGMELDTVKYPHDTAGYFYKLIDDAVVDTAGAVIKRVAPDLSWVYLEYTDEMGHRHGNGKYLTDAVLALDKQIGTIFNAIQYREKNFNEEWQIYITTDHGREDNGYHHGGQETRERTTWIATNAKGLNNYFFSQQAGIVDILPSMASFLKVKIPREQIMELDGVSLIGKLSVTNCEAVIDKDIINIKWKVQDKEGMVKIWLTTTNNFKTGGKDKYQLVKTVLVINGKASIDIRKYPSNFYKVVIEAPKNFLNRWVAVGGNSSFIRNKIEGLITGTLFGDALGGPIEFQGHPEIQASPGPPKLWTDTNNIINDAELKAARERIYFREYKHILPHVQPYGCWSENAAPGTVTDDSRHKIILMYFLRNAMEKKQWPVNEKTLAQAYLDWPKSATIKKHPGYDTLCSQWLDESYKAINWLMGSREIGKAYPLERLWNAYPTCYGEMALTPMAALYPGQPEKAYLSAYNLAWFDNGFAKDMIGASVAGLSVALTLDPTKMTNEQLWDKVFTAIKTTDPYDYLKVPWCWRAVDRWLYVVDDFVKQANGSPAKLFALFEKEFMYNAKWEAQIPFVVSFACLKICKYDPIAAMQLCIEWGYDHDSYPQFLGAFVGAIYGPDIFKADMRTTVAKRLQLDYDESIDEWVNTLMKVQQLGIKKELFKTK